MYESIMNHTVCNLDVYLIVTLPFAQYSTVLAAELALWRSSSGLSERHPFDTGSSNAYICSYQSRLF
jgi:hypothetical protein